VSLFVGHHAEALGHLDDGLTVDGAAAAAEVRQPRGLRGRRTGSSTSDPSGGFDEGFRSRCCKVPERKTPVVAGGAMPMTPASPPEVFVIPIRRSPSPRTPALGNPGVVPPAPAPSNPKTPAVSLAVPVVLPMAPLQAPWMKAPSRPQQPGRVVGALGPRTVRVGTGSERADRVRAGPQTPQPDGERRGVSSVDANSGPSKTPNSRVVFHPKTTGPPENCPGIQRTRSFSGETLPLPT
jgi:hypothetical protein